MVPLRGVGMIVFPRQPLHLATPLSLINSSKFNSPQDQLLAMTSTSVVDVAVLGKVPLLPFYRPPSFPASIVANRRPREPAYHLRFEQEDRSK